MDTGALRSYVDRSRELLESSPELSERNTQIRLVQPFLTALGWELRQIEADRDVATAEGSVTVDFALLVDDEPAVLVETSACAADLQREQAERLGRRLLAAGVDRGVLTNGHEFVFVAADDDSEPTDALDRSECRLPELPDHADAVSHYARETVEQSVRDGRRRRREAAAALADEREAVIADIHERLVATAGDAVAERLRAESEQVIDDLIASLRGDADDGDQDEGGEAESPTDVETKPPTDAGTGLDTEPERALAAVAGSASDALSEPGSTDADADIEQESHAGSNVPADALGATVAEDGQYVVRLFGGRTSVWAVGHARAAMTTAQAIEYLLDRGADDGRGAPADEGAESIAPPWGPEGEYPVLRGSAVENATVELSNGCHLDARVPVDVARAAIERLAERAGLRAMFQGEWSAE